MKWLICVFGISLTAQILNVEKERALGKAFADQIRKETKPMELAEVSTYVETIGTRLGAERFEVVVTQEPAEPIGLPGGTVFVPASFLLAAEDEAELAVMMAHAVGHVRLRHGFVNAQQARDGQIPLFFMGGWMGAHSNATDRRMFIPAALLGSVKQNELDADRFAVELAAKAGFDAGALARYVQRVQPADSGPMAPVPPKLERLSALAGVEGVGGVVSGSEFARVKEMVRVKLSLARKPPSLAR